MRAMRPLPVAMLLTVLGTTGPARAIDVIDLTWPARDVSRFKPEADRPPEHPEYFGAVERARAELDAGQHRRALATLHAANDADPVAAAVIRGTALAAVGEHDAALAALNGDAPPVVVARAEVLTDLGRGDEAVALLVPLVAGRPDRLDARLALGLAQERTGDTRAAEATYGWFVEKPQQFLDRWQGGGGDAVFDSADNVTVIARAVDRHAALTGGYRNNPALDQAIYGMFVRAYDVIDRGHVPARLAAAEYLLAHDKRDEAVADLEAVLDANPRHAGALYLMGLVAASTWNFDAADRVVDELRATDPTSARADLLEARNLLAQRRPLEAESPVRRVIARQPRNIEALGLLAATYALRLLDEPMRQALADVERLDPDNATAYFDVAEQLGAMRQYPRSAAMYQIAIDRAPNWIDPRNGLGLLYTQWGDEDAARATLEAARELDPFNVRTTNYLRLLDYMAEFARVESDNFVLLYDARADPILPRYFMEYLESIYADVTGNYKAPLAEKTLIEVFPSHDMFSVRTTGAPWIGTVGASTGRVIALVAPRAGERTMGPFNWTNVLRHEFTHTVTLAATENRIQHWMTDGLAVLEEGVPLRWEWVPMLNAAVKDKRLFDLDELTWAFIRPKRPSDRQQAYAQSFWVCQYIRETYGHDAILRMLAEFRNAGRQEEVFPTVTGRTKAEFHTDFVAWAERQVAGWGYDEATTKRYDELRERGEGLVTARQYAEAARVWAEIAAIRPMDALPHQRLAGIYLQKDAGDPAKAIEHLKRLHAVELKDNRYAKRVAKLYKGMDDLPNAARYATEAIYVNPYDLDAHKLLLSVHEQAGDGAGIEKQREVIAQLEQLAEDTRGGAGQE